MCAKDRENGSNYVDLSKANSLSRRDKKLFEDFFEYLKYKKDFGEYLKRKEEVKGGFIPISVFSNKVLAPLETIVKYLREELGYTYKKIGLLLNRKAGPIGVTYRNAVKKLKSKLDVSSIENSIPISIFRDSKLTVFESSVVHLRDTKKLSFGRIAELLNRNYRTIYTVYSRARKKNVR